MWSVYRPPEAGYRTHDIIESTMLSGGSAGQSFWEVMSLLMDE